MWLTSIEIHEVYGQEAGRKRKYVYVYATNVSYFTLMHLKYKKNNIMQSLNE